MPDAVLPTIPYHDLRGRSLAELAGLERGRFEDIHAVGRAHYGMAALKLGDAVSRRWLARNGNPYLGEIDRVRDLARHEGAYLLNMSYEWTCTTGAGPDPSGVGNRMLRTLDWPLEGLGRNVVVARHDGPAGEYFDVTWPGFVGITTAMAPGRFSAAINQPPMRQWTPSCWVDWAINRGRIWRRRALPPVHLLRRVFDRCGDYGAARAALAETPIAMPAFFTLSGAAAAESCLIERTEDAAHVVDGPTACANHWRFLAEGDRARGIDSRGRLAAMEARRDGAKGGFSWVAPPILNETTRLSVVANAAAGGLLVRGWERDGAATRPFDLADLARKPERRIVS